MNTSDDVRSIHRALGAAFTSAYHHGSTAVGVSVLWFFGLLPVVTIGPATLAAYTAVLSLRQDGHVDRSRVRATVSAQWFNSVLLSGAFALFAVVTVVYLIRFLRTGATLAGGLGVVGTYLTFHLGVILIVAFVRLADGFPVADAVSDGYRWTASHPLDTVLLGVVTAVLFVISAVLTIAFCLLFGFVAFTFHAITVSDQDIDSAAPST